MAFKDMINKLKADGLLDDNGQMTQKGHDYVKETIKSLDERAYQYAQEGKIETPPSQTRTIERPIMWRYR